MSVNHQTPTAVHRSVLTLKAAMPVTVQVVTCLTVMECLALVRTQSISVEVYMQMCRAIFLRLH